MKKFLNRFSFYGSQFTQIAFTLAETLIVIGILGVVAALTLPNLNHATGDKERITKVNKIYASLTDAFDRALAVYGPYDEWFSDTTVNATMPLRTGERLTEFMKTSKICKSGNDKSCFFTMQIEDSAYRFNLSDGTGIKIADCNTSEDTCLIEVGIDGNKGKKWRGYDVFFFRIKKSSVEPVDIPWGASSLFNHNHVGSSRWIIDYGNMDYLKADETGKCDDNPSIILDGVTNTSCH